ncbi:uncharacterized protein KD926_002600 [Aspergillus affinis]|uniref:uncharacterized protein n=1 Tax=Aspergillus affinis TaxID=1070780 RepID=UPI0022FE8583|nr:uncharacterized protein KD926_002600 [Aspergillus affinis]KAI9035935.1 hypothetical protein KD926_002600 [Aspergillus affinis]
MDARLMEKGRVAMERARLPKDETVARVFKIDPENPRPSEQYNGLVLSDPAADWEEWYFWCPLPEGEYYAKPLLEMMLIMMGTDLCYIMNQKLDENPEFDSGIYWITDIVEKDRVDGPPGIFTKIRNEIETVLKENRFPENEKRRISLEERYGSKPGGSPSPFSSGNSTPAGSRKPSPPQQTQQGSWCPRWPSKAIPIVDPNTVGKDTPKGTQSSETQTPSSVSTPRRPSKAVPIVNPTSAPAKASADVPPPAPAKELPNAPAPTAGSTPMHPLESPIPVLTAAPAPVHPMASVPVPMYPLASVPAPIAGPYPTPLMMNAPRPHYASMPAPYPGMPPQWPPQGTVFYRCPTYPGSSYGTLPNPFPYNDPRFHNTVPVHVDARGYPIPQRFTDNTPPPSAPRGPRNVFLFR